MLWAAALIEQAWLGLPDLINSRINIMKGAKPKSDERGKFLYAEPKFMIPPDPLKLPEPFRSSPRKEDPTRRRDGA